MRPWLLLVRLLPSVNRSVFHVTLPHLIAHYLTSSPKLIMSHILISLTCQGGALQYWFTFFSFSFLKADPCRHCRCLQCRSAGPNQQPVTSAWPGSQPNAIDRRGGGGAQHSPPSPSYIPNYWLQRAAQGGNRKLSSRRTLCMLNILSSR